MSPRNCFLHSLRLEIQARADEPFPSALARLVFLYWRRRYFGCCGRRGFWFPCCRQGLARRNLICGHLPFRRMEFILIEFKIIPRSQSQPHVGLDWVARKILIALQIALAEEQLGVLLSLIGRKPQPFHSFRYV